MVGVVCVPVDAGGQRALRTRCACTFDKYFRPVRRRPNGQALTHTELSRTCFPPSVILFQYAVFL